MATVFVKLTDMTDSDGGSKLNIQLMSDTELPPETDPEKHTPAQRIGRAIFLTARAMLMHLNIMPEAHDPLPPQHDLGGEG